MPSFSILLNVFKLCRAKVVIVSPTAIGLLALLLWAWAPFRPSAFLGVLGAGCILGWRVRFASEATEGLGGWVLFIRIQKSPPSHGPSVGNPGIGCGHPSSPCLPVLP